MRTRTPSDLKFLLNERAALAGATRVAEQNIVTLLAKVREDEARLAARRLQLQQLLAAQASNMQELRALDLTLAAAYPKVHPEAAGVVNAWCEPAGRKRGDLKRVVLGCVRLLAPAPVTTGAVVEATAAELGWPLGSPEERRRAFHLVRQALRRGRDAGQVEPVHASADGEQGSWRWKDQGPVGADLLRLAGREQDANPAGGEVGGQRARRGHG